MAHQRNHLLFKIEGQCLDSLNPQCQVGTADCLEFQSLEGRDMASSEKSG